MLLRAVPVKRGGTSKVHDGFVYAELKDPRTGDTISARVPEALAADLLLRAPQGDWFTAQAKVRVGRVVVERGLHGEAEALLLPCYPILQAQVGDAHSLTREIRALLVELYTAWGRPEAARAYQPRDAAR